MKQVSSFPRSSVNGKELGKDGLQLELVPIYEVAFLFLLLGAGRFMVPQARS